MANNKRYEGTRLQGGRRMVTVTSGLDTHPLSFPADLVGSDFHFTAGDFIWGYRGSGPRDLAAALAYDLLSAHKGSLFHLRLARNFESPIYTEIVVCLPSEGWVLNDHEIMEVVRNSVIENPADYTGGIFTTARGLVWGCENRPGHDNLAAEDLAMFAIGVDTEIRSYLESILRLPDATVDILLDPFEHWKHSHYQRPH